MRKFTSLLLLLPFLACTKSDVRPSSTLDRKALRIEGIPTASVALTGYTLYTIASGAHYCDKSTLKSVSTKEMKFNTVFDPSAIYTTLDPVNQYDVNKLWGFSEGLSNQYNSCRIGWSWNDGVYGGVYQVGTTALRLSAYAYAKGVRYIKEIAIVPLNVPIWSSIKLSGTSYVCTVSFVESGITKTFSATVPRGSTTTTASGYQQYPYFGGNETAPHAIFINIQPL